MPYGRSQGAWGKADEPGGQRLGGVRKCGAGAAGPEGGDGLASALLIRTPAAVVRAFAAACTGIGRMESAVVPCGGGVPDGAAAQREDIHCAATSGLGFICSSPAAEETSPAVLGW